MPSWLSHGTFGQVRSWVAMEHAAVIIRFQILRRDDEGVQACFKIRIRLLYIGTEI